MHVPLDETMLIIIFFRFDKSLLRHYLFMFSAQNSVQNILNNFDSGLNAPAKNQEHKRIHQKSRAQAYTHSDHKISEDKQ